MTTTTDTKDAPTTTTLNGTSTVGAITKYDYKPTAPVEKIGNLKALLDAQRSAIGRVIAKHVTPERLATMLLTAATKDPGILKCTQESIFRVAITAAELGLDISGTLGDAYVVPFNNKVGDKWVSTATLIIGYRGLARLARNTGGVARIESNVVCANDAFEFEQGTTFTLRFRQSTGDRGKAIGAYALVQFNDGSFQAEYMTRDDIENIRSMAKSGNSPAWSKSWGEMARKTVFRRLAKWLPLSPEKDASLLKAMEVDDADYEHGEKRARREVEPGTDAVRKALGIGGEPEFVDHETGEVVDGCSDPDPAADGA